MNDIPLFYVWTYTDADRAFWAEHLEGFVPRRIIDAHVHVSSRKLMVREPTEEMRRQYWVNEVNEPSDAPTAARCNELCYPGGAVGMVAFGYPTLEFDLEAQNRYIQDECSRRGWHSLSVITPHWTAAQVAAELDKPTVIGAKVYYSLISYNADTRDEHLEASIFDFLPHHQLEVLNDRGAWLTLHVPKAARLGHPDNIREVKEIRRRYPDIVLVIAHLGRCYTEEHAREAIPPLADDPGLYFDNSAVLNHASYRIAHQHLRIDQILYGSDNPVFYMRGRRQYRGRTYINRTNYPFYFNKDREPPEVEAKYVLYMYEAIKAIKDVCQDLQMSKADVEKLFCGNAQRLIAGVLARKSRR